jgi:hypothetical protein
VCVYFGNPLGINNEVYIERRAKNKLLSINHRSQKIIFVYIHSNNAKRSLGHNSRLAFLATEKEREASR